MFDRYFRPAVAARLRDGPDADLLLGLLGHLDQLGYAPATIGDYLLPAERFLHWLRLRRIPLSDIDEAIVRRFACPSPRQRPLKNVLTGLRHLLACLRRQGRVPPRPAPAPAHIEEVVAGFDAHLRDVAGLTQSTRRGRCYYARLFLSAVFAAGPICWDRLQATDLQAFIEGYARSGRTGAALLAASSLRRFLRWLQFAGLLATDLTGALPPLRTRPRDGLPPTLTPQQEQALLDCFDLTSPVGRRDRTMTLCLLRLGLRVGEVAALTVADLDADAATLRIAPGKVRRTRLLPLPASLRDALVAYLHLARPASDDPHLFLRCRTPVGVATTRALIRAVLRRAYAKVAGCEHLTGTHVLRHTAATRLHRAGADLKHLADILGHKSIDTTAQYARVDLQRLATVALPWPQQPGGQP